MKFFFNLNSLSSEDYNDEMLEKPTKRFDKFKYFGGIGKRSQDPSLYLKRLLSYN